MYCTHTIFIFHNIFVWVLIHFCSKWGWHLSYMHVSVTHKWTNYLKELLSRSRQIGEAFPEHSWGESEGKFLEHLGLPRNGSVSGRVELFFHRLYWRDAPNQGKRTITTCIATTSQKKWFLQFSEGLVKSQSKEVVAPNLIRYVLNFSSNQLTPIRPQPHLFL